jgi:hypothetical protein
MQVPENLLKKSPELYRMGRGPDHWPAWLSLAMKQSELVKAEGRNKGSTSLLA